MKRAADLALSLVAVVLLLPVLLVTTLAILVSMGRPILYRDRRAGRDGTPFSLYKFRTMRPVATDGDQTDAARTTRLGRFLRRSSIDELPSLLNIVRGDMSIVGPRPLPVRYTSRYTAYQARRLEVRPGLTGLAQSAGRNLLSWDEKFRLDVEYVETRSFWLDVKVFFKSFVPVLRGTGVNATDQITMPEFTGSSARPSDDRPPAHTGPAPSIHATE